MGQPIGLRGHHPAKAILSGHSPPLPPVTPAPAPPPPPFPSPQPAPPLSPIHFPSPDPGSQVVGRGFNSIPSDRQPLLGAGSTDRLPSLPDLLCLLGPLTIKSTAQASGQLSLFISCCMCISNYHFEVGWGAVIAFLRNKYK